MSERISTKVIGPVDSDDPTAVIQFQDEIDACFDNQYQYVDVKFTTSVAYRKLHLTALVITKRNLD